MGIDRVPLADFLTTPSGVARPEGYVYLWQGRPFLQLHLFEDEYTIFWRGSSGPADLLHWCQPATEEAAAEIRRSGSSVDSWYFNVRAFQPAYSTGQSEATFADLAPGALPVDHANVDSVRKRLTVLQPPTLATYVALASSPPGQWNFTLWADTPGVDETSLEAGLTSNVSLTSVAHEMFSRTSLFTDKLATAEVVDLFSNEVARRVQQRMRPRIRI